METDGKGVSGGALRREKLRNSWAFAIPREALILWAAKNGAVVAAREHVGEPRPVV